MELIKSSEHIKVSGHRGTWYVIDDGFFFLKKAVTHCFLLEHETYGDMAACVIATEDGDLVLEDVWNGFDDLREAIEYGEV